MTTCRSLRTRESCGQSRWCAIHGREFLELKARQYVTRAGSPILTFQRHWSTHLAVLAHTGFVLNMSPPGDVAVWFQFCLLVAAPQCGKSISPVEFALIFFAHAAKWPPAVVHLCDRAVMVLEDTRNNVQNAGVKIIDMWYDMLDFVANKPFKKTHAEMSVGFVSVSSGLVAASREMGMISKIHNAEERQEYDDEECIKLGSTQVPYHRRPRAECTEADEIAQFVVDTQCGHHLRWPTKIEEIPSFADNIMTLARSIRSHKVGNGKIGLKGGKTDDHEYLCKHFLRLMLMIVNMLLPGAFKSFKMSTIANWTPDERKLIQEIDGLTGEKAERLAGSLNSHIGIYSRWKKNMACPDCRAQLA